MTWMITGGAGYIGSHLAREMEADGIGAVVVDDLSTGYADRVPPGTPMIRSDVSNRDAMATAMAEHRVSGVVHLAAKKAVEESVAQPLFYFDQNVSGLIQLLLAMDDAGIDKIIYSSSAAVYGAPSDGYVTEHSPTHPVSPYGQTKVVGEWLARDSARARAIRGGGMSVVSLRYFNVAGAGAPDLGDTSVANLIPLVFRAITDGRDPQIFGTDYDTPDGTCIRDYIHVTDLARAHVDAIRECERAAAGDVRLTLNVGTGKGASVREVMSVVREVTGIDFAAREAGRRAGDPAVLVAQADKIAEVLGWKPVRDLREMVSSAWAAWSSR